jgi:predicted TIM-barrel fold metal-dependent hydrolase
MRKIDFEAHFATEEWIQALVQNEGYPRIGMDKKTNRRRFYFSADAIEPFSDVLQDKLLDLEETRITEMDSAEIDVQVPGVEHFDPSTGTALAKHCNDFLAGVIDKNPYRFVGFASLCPKDPEEAVKELERAVKELGLKGWKTHSNYGDIYPDDKRFWPIFAKAEALDVPIYLHPTAPMISQLHAYGFALAGAPFGFGIETSMVMMRLVFSGVLEAFPNLKIILGHLGEGLPFILQRIDFPYVRPHFKNDPEVVPQIKKKPSDYLLQNMFVSTSGNYLEPAFMCTKEAMGIDRILLATDYPFEDPTECMQFLEGLPLAREDKDKVYYQNAKQVGIEV